MLQNFFIISTQRFTQKFYVHTNYSCFMRDLQKQCDVTWPEPITERRRQRLIMHACIFGQRFNPPTALLNGVKYREILSAILPIPIEHLPRVENDDKFCQFHACSLTFKEIRRIGRILDFYRNFLVSVFGLISIFIKKKPTKNIRSRSYMLKKLIDHTSL